MGPKPRLVTVDVVARGAPERPAIAGFPPVSRFPRRALFAGGGIVVGGIVIGGLPRLATSAPSARQDAEILAFALELERLQEAFYAEALRSLDPPGELGRFARVVGGHERAHREFIEKALGGDAKPPSEFDFGDTLSDTKAFLDAAVALEETAVAAYNGQATNLTPKTLASAATIVSVEARHASWARALAGEEPAPRGSDRAIGAKRAQAELSQTGLVAQ